MKINKVNYDFDDVALPSLEEAQEVCKKFIDIQNGNILLIVPQAPTKTKKGIQVGEAVTKPLQNRIDGEGLMIVKYCPSLNDIPQVSIKNGDFVYLNAGTPVIGKIIKEYKGQKYVVVVAQGYSIVSTVEKPNYKFDE